MFAGKSRKNPKRSLLWKDLNLPSSSVKPGRLPDAPFALNRYSIIDILNINAEREEVVVQF